jgi:hypothetical protein
VLAPFLSAALGAVLAAAFGLCRATCKKLCVMVMILGISVYACLSSCTMLSIKVTALMC